jgi:hypothetical protein
MCRHRVPAPVGDAFDRRLEGRILEGLDLAAVVAHEVMVVVAAGKRGLEARHAVPEIDALDESETVESLERAVDARDPDAWPCRPEAVMDFLRRQAAPLPAEQLDDRAPGAPAAPARLA